MRSIHRDGPFGGCDEQAEVDAFHELVGSTARANRLERIFRDARYNTAQREKLAEDAGFTQEEYEALYHLWNQ